MLQSVSLTHPTSRHRLSYSPTTPHYSTNSAPQQAQTSPSAPPTLLPGVQLAAPPPLHPCDVSAFFVPRVALRRVCLPSPDRTGAGLVSCFLVSLAAATCSHPRKPCLQVPDPEADEGQDNEKDYDYNGDDYVGLHGGWGMGICVVAVG